MILSAVVFLVCFLLLAGWALWERHARSVDVGLQQLRAIQRRERPWPISRLVAVLGAAPEGETERDERMPPEIRRIAELRERLVELDIDELAHSEKGREAAADLLREYAGAHREACDHVDEGLSERLRRLEEGLAAVARQLDGSPPPGSRRARFLGAVGAGGVAFAVVHAATGGGSSFVGFMIAVAAGLMVFLGCLAWGSPDRA